MAGTLSNESEQPLRILKRMCKATRGAPSQSGYRPLSAKA